MQVSPPRPARRAARLVADLAKLYHRHDDPARALALALAAMRLGDDRPEVALLVASSFLRTGDAEQALAALSRLEGAAGDAIRGAARVLEAKAMHRLGDAAGARRRLAEAALIAAADDAKDAPR